MSVVVVILVVVVVIVVVVVVIALVVVVWYSCFTARKINKTRLFVFILQTVVTFAVLYNVWMIIFRITFVEMREDVSARM